MNDIFISYGRAESKTFAAKLFDRLKKEGLSIWFDQEDIPLGSDFQEQIDRGIEASQNFVFIIAPHALKSPYCLKEIQHAVKYNKRIIPILHIEPTSQDIWDKMHPVISRLNWIYMRQEENESTDLSTWKDIDDFEKGFEGLTQLMRSHQDFVKMHTHILVEAINWQLNQQATSWLLIGKERKEADEWLKNSTNPQGLLLPDGTFAQLPSQPSDLHCEYICESRKNAENLMTDVFISFPSADSNEKNIVNHTLIRHGITTWTHGHDIESGRIFEEAVQEGIEQADNFLLFITEDSIDSIQCQKELEYAISLNKRIVPLLIEPVKSTRIPASVRELKLIDFTDNKIDEDLWKDIDDLLAEIRKDKDYHHEHKVWLTQALKWKRQNENLSILLRGFSLEKAKTWLILGKKRKAHPPLPLHEEFIDTSATKSGLLHTEVFVSYSRTDSDMARKINGELQLLGKTTWFDQENIASGTDFQQEINHGIANASNFLFLISEDSIDSPYCKTEIGYVFQTGKRVITALIGKVNPEIVPEQLRILQWIDFVSKDFSVAFSELVRTLDTDREYVQMHTKWAQMAHEWQKGEQHRDYLLKGVEYTLAEEWHKKAKEEDKKPAPTALQVEHLAASALQMEVSRLRKERINQRLRLSLVAASLGLVLAVGGIIFAIIRNQELRKTRDDFASLLEVTRKSLANETEARQQIQLALEEVEKQKGIAKQSSTVATVAQEQASVAKRKESFAEEAKDVALRQREAAIEALETKQDSLKIALGTSEKAQKDAENAIKELESLNFQYNAVLELLEDPKKNRDKIEKIQDEILSMPRSFVINHVDGTVIYERSGQTLKKGLSLKIGSKDRIIFKAANAKAVMRSGSKHYTVAIPANGKPNAQGEYIFMFKEVRQIK